MEKRLIVKKASGKRPVIITMVDGGNGEMILIDRNDEKGVYILRLT